MSNSGITSWPCPMQLTASMCRVNEKVICKKTRDVVKKSLQSIVL